MCMCAYAHDYVCAFMCVSVCACVSKCECVCACNIYYAFTPLLLTVILSVDIPVYNLLPENIDSSIFGL